MKILVVDDEKSTRKNIVHLFHNYYPDPYEIIEAGDIQSGIEEIEEKHPDIVLLDIKLPDGSGFDLLQRIHYSNFKLIFITAHEKFVFKAYEFSAVGFILKPINPTKLFTAIENAKQQLKREKTSLKINSQYSQRNKSIEVIQEIEVLSACKLIKVKIDEIIACDSHDDKTLFNLINNKKILATGNILEYEEKLAGYGFCSIHPKHLINIKYIDHYSSEDGGNVVMKDHSIKAVSKMKRDNFLKLLEMI